MAVKFLFSILCFAISLTNLSMSSCHLFFQIRKKKPIFFSSYPFVSSLKFSRSILFRFFFPERGGPLLKFFFRRLLTLIIACEYFKVGEILPDIRVRVQPIPISICSRLQLFFTRKPMEQI